MNNFFTQFGFIKKLLKDQTGISLGDAKEYLVENRLNSLARTKGFTNYIELIDNSVVKNREELKKEIVETLLICETFFFRDEKSFDLLREKIIPYLIEENRSKRSLNIWSCSCSSGQEPYSLAIFLKENFPQLDSWKINILGTDISDKVLNKAKSALYSELEMRRGIRPKIKSKYFIKQGHHWTLSAPIKSMVHFRNFNIINCQAKIPTMDLIFLRNVLIYFEPETRQKALNQVTSFLKPNGYLFLGRSETMNNVDNEFLKIKSNNSMCHMKK